MSALLKTLDFPFDPTLTGGVFWVAVFQQRVVGVCFVESVASAVFLSYIGVDPQFRKQEISKTMIDAILRHYQCDGYLDTVAPQIYLSMDLNVIDRPDFLPPRIDSECASCHPERCVCMVKYYDHS